ncbi:MAG: mannitol dehydrogenase family protein, partial [Alphaproteobacteria bacterium]
MTRLDETRLDRLPPAVAVPRFDRAGTAVGIVHLGIGAFHRAHMAVHVDDLLGGGGGDWAICGVSLRSPAVRDALAPQHGLYTVVERGAEGERLRVVGAVKEILVAPESPAAVLDRMAAPATRIVSLTVTEKGYCHEPATGALDETHPGIVHDLSNAQAPQTAIGFLVAALDRRRRAGLSPFTVLSCDNLPSNGDTAARIVRRFAELRDAELGRWVGDRVAFPNTMVDRIVPATTDGDRAA